MDKTEQLQEKLVIEPNKEINDPHRLVCEGVIVNLRFSDTGKDLSTHLINYFKGLKNS